jgi:hypothetical protein
MARHALKCTFITWKKRHSIDSTEQSKLGVQRPSKPFLSRLCMKNVLRYFIGPASPDTELGFDTRLWLSVSTMTGQLGSFPAGSKAELHRRSPNQSQSTEYHELPRKMACAAPIHFLNSLPFTCQISDALNRPHHIHIEAPIIYDYHLHWN